MAKTFLKRFLIIISTLAIFILLYSYLAIVLMPKDADDFGGAKYYNYVGIEAEKDNSIDMLVCGNSDAYCGFSPMEFYRQTGTTSYVRAGARESIISLSKTIHHTYKRQKFHFLLLDCDCLFTKNSMIAGTNGERLKPYGAPIVLHSRWKELTFKDFITFPKAHKDLFKGYTLEKNIFPYEKPENYMEIVDEKLQNLDKKVEKELKNLIKWCKKRKIELFLTCMPSPYSWNKSRSLIVDDFAKEHSLTFLDLNYPTANYCLDYSTSFKDNGNHLNIKGATYTTKYLSTILANFYSLPNHKADPNYKSWNTDLIEYDAKTGALL